MQTDHDAVSPDWAAAETDWQSAPADVAIQRAQPQPSCEKPAGRCSSALACSGGAGGGFLAAHTGCLLSPTLAFMTATGGASLSLFSLASSFVLTGAGLGAWYLARGKDARRLEKAMTAGGALTGAVMAAGLHLTGGSGHHHDTESALAWYQAQSDSTRAQLVENARSMRLPLADYVIYVCGPPPGKSAHNQVTLERSRPSLKLDK